MTYKWIFKDKNATLKQTLDNKRDKNLQIIGSDTVSFKDFTVMNAVGNSINFIPQIIEYGFIAGTQKTFGNISNNFKSF